MRGNIPRLRLIWRAAWSDGVMQMVGMCGLYLAVRGLGLAVRRCVGKRGRGRSDGENGREGG